MKQIRIVLFLILAVITFSGCTNKFSTSSTLQSNASSSSNSIHIENSNTKFSLHMINKFNSEGTSSQLGYYYVEPLKDGAHNLKYLDYATKQSIYLCDRPECGHDTENCNSWLPNSGGTIAPILAGDKLYLLFYGGDTYSYSILGDIALPRIETIDINGADRRKIANIDIKRELSGQCATDGNHLYMLAESVRESSTQGVSLVQELIKIEISSGRVETLKTLPDTQAFLVGAIEDKLIISSFRATALGFSNPDIIFYSIPITGGELSQIKMANRADEYSLYDEGILYTIDKIHHEIIETDVVSKKEILRLSYDKTALEDPTSGFVCDNHLIVYDIVSIDGNPETQVKSIDLTTAKVEQITLGYDEDIRRIPLEPIAEYGDYFLSTVGRKLVDTLDIIDNVTYQIPIFEYALISKRDYLQSNSVYIYFEQIN